MADDEPFTLEHLKGLAALVKPRDVAAVGVTHAVNITDGQQAMHAVNEAVVTLRNVLANAEHTYRTACAELDNCTEDETKRAQLRGNREEAYGRTERAEIRLGEAVQRLTRTVQAVEAAEADGADDAALGAIWVAAAAEAGLTADVPADNNPNEDGEAYMQIQWIIDVLEMPTQALSTSKLHEWLQRCRAYLERQSPHIMATMMSGATNAGLAAATGWKTKYANGVVWEAINEAFVNDAKNTIQQAVDDNNRALATSLSIIFATRSLYDMLSYMEKMRRRDGAILFGQKLLKQRATIYDTMRYYSHARWRDAYYHPKMRRGDFATAEDLTLTLTEAYHPITSYENKDGTLWWNDPYVRHSNKDGTIIKWDKKNNTTSKDGKTQRLQQVWLSGRPMDAVVVDVVDRDMLKQLPVHATVQCVTSGSYTSYMGNRQRADAALHERLQLPTGTIPKRCLWASFAAHYDTTKHMLQTKPLRDVLAMKRRANQLATAHASSAKQDMLNFNEQVAYAAKHGIQPKFRLPRVSKNTERLKGELDAAERAIGRLESPKPCYFMGAWKAPEDETWPCLLEHVTNAACLPHFKEAEHNLGTYWGMVAVDKWGMGLSHPPPKRLLKAFNTYLAASVASNAAASVTELINRVAPGAYGTLPYPRYPVTGVTFVEAERAVAEQEKDGRVKVSQLNHFSASGDEDLQHKWTMLFEGQGRYPSAEDGQLHQIRPDCHMVGTGIPSSYRTEWSTDQLNEVLNDAYDITADVTNQLIDQASVDNAPGFLISQVPDWFALARRTELENPPSSSVFDSEVYATINNTGVISLRRAIGPSVQGWWERVNPDELLSRYERAETAEDKMRLLPKLVHGPDDSAHNDGRSKVMYENVLVESLYHSGLLNAKYARANWMNPVLDYLCDRDNQWMAEMATRHQINHRTREEHLMRTAYFEAVPYWHRFAGGSHFGCVVNMMLTGLRAHRVVEEQPAMRLLDTLVTNVARMTPLTFNHKVYGRHLRKARRSHMMGGDPGTINSTESLLHACPRPGTAMLFYCVLANRAQYIRAITSSRGIAGPEDIMNRVENLYTRSNTHMDYGNLAGISPSTTSAAAQDYKYWNPNDGLTERAASTGGGYRVGEHVHDLRRTKYPEAFNSMCVRIIADIVNTGTEKKGADNNSTVRLFAMHIKAVAFSTVTEVMLLALGACPSGRTNGNRATDDATKQIYYETLENVLGSCAAFYATVHAECNEWIDESAALSEDGDGTANAIRYLRATLMYAATGIGAFNSDKFVTEFTTNVMSQSFWGDENPPAKMTAAYLDLSDSEDEAADQTLLGYEHEHTFLDQMLGPVIHPECYPDGIRLSLNDGVIPTIAAAFNKGTWPDAHPVWFASNINEEKQAIIHKLVAPLSTLYVDASRDAARDINDRYFLSMSSAVEQTPTTSPVGSYYAPLFGGSPRSIANAIVELDTGGDTREPFDLPGARATEPFATVLPPVFPIDDDDEQGVDSLSEAERSILSVSVHSDGILTASQMAEMRFAPKTPGKHDMGMLESNASDSEDDETLSGHGAEESSILEKSIHEMRMFRDSSFSSVATDINASRPEDAPANMNLPNLSSDNAVNSSVVQGSIENQSLHNRLYNGSQFSDQESSDSDDEHEHSHITISSTEESVVDLRNTSISSVSSAASVQWTGTITRLSSHAKKAVHDVTVIVEDNTKLSSDFSFSNAAQSFSMADVMINGGPGAEQRFEAAMNGVPTETPFGGPPQSQSTPKKSNDPTPQPSPQPSPSPQPKSSNLRPKKDPMTFAPMTYMPHDMTVPIVGALPGYDPEVHEKDIREKAETDLRALFDEWQEDTKATVDEFNSFEDKNYEHYTNNQYPWSYHEENYNAALKGYHSRLKKILDNYSSSAPERLARYKNAVADKRAAYSAAAAAAAPDDDDDDDDYDDPRSHRTTGNPVEELVVNNPHTKDPLNEYKGFERHTEEYITKFKDMFKENTAKLKDMFDSVEAKAKGLGERWSNNETALYTTMMTKFEKAKDDNVKKAAAINEYENGHTGLTRELQKEFRDNRDEYNTKRQEIAVEFNAEQHKLKFDVNGMKALIAEERIKKIDLVINGTVVDAQGATDVYDSNIRMFNEKVDTIRRKYEQATTPTMRANVDLLSDTLKGIVTDYKQDIAKAQTEITRHYNNVLEITRQYNTLYNTIRKSDDGPRKLNTLALMQPYILPSDGSAEAIKVEDIKATADERKALYDQLKAIPIGPTTGGASSSFLDTTVSADQDFLTPQAQGIISTDNPGRRDGPIPIMQPFAADTPLTSATTPSKNKAGMSDADVANAILGLSIAVSNGTTKKRITPEVVANPVRSSVFTLEIDMDSSMSDDESGLVFVAPTTGTGIDYAGTLFVSPRVTVTDENDNEKSIGFDEFILSALENADGDRKVSANTVGEILIDYSRKMATESFLFAPQQIVRSLVMQAAILVEENLNNPKTKRAFLKGLKRDVAMALMSYAEKYPTAYIPNKRVGDITHVDSIDSIYDRIAMHMITKFEALEPLAASGMGSVLGSPTTGVMAPALPANELQTQTLTTRAVLSSNPLLNNVAKELDAILEGGKLTDNARPVITRKTYKSLLKAIKESQDLIASMETVSEEMTDQLNKKITGIENVISAQNKKLVPVNQGIDLLRVMDAKHLSGVMFYIATTHSRVPDGSGGSAFNKAASAISTELKPSKLPNQFGKWDGSSKRYTYMSKNRRGTDAASSVFNEDDGYHMTIMNLTNSLIASGKNGDPPKQGRWITRERSADYVLRAVVLIDAIMDYVSFTQSEMYRATTAATGNDAKAQAAKGVLLAPMKPVEEKIDTTNRIHASLDVISLLGVDVTANADDTILAGKIAATETMVNQMTNYGKQLLVALHQDNDATAHLSQYYLRIPARGNQVRVTHDLFRSDLLRLVQAVLWCVTGMQAADEEMHTKAYKMLLHRLLAVSNVLGLEYLKDIILAIGHMKIQRQYKKNSTAATNPTRNRENATFHKQAELDAVNDVKAVQDHRNMVFKDVFDERYQVMETNVQTAYTTVVHSYAEFIQDIVTPLPGNDGTPASSILIPVDDIEGEDLDDTAGEYDLNEDAEEGILDGIEGDLSRISNFMEVVSSVNTTMRESRSASSAASPSSASPASSSPLSVGNTTTSSSPLSVGNTTTSSSLDESLRMLDDSRGGIFERMNAEIVNDALFTAVQAKGVPDDAVVDLDSTIVDA